MAVNCMKCGREISEKQVFCPECLADMQRYPVRPGTPVQLPSRSAQSPQKVSYKKKEVPSEKKLRRQRRAIAILSFLLVITMGLLSVASVLLWRSYTEDVPDSTIGQNYSAVETDDP